MRQIYEDENIMIPHPFYSSGLTLQVAILNISVAKQHQCICLSWYAPYLFHMFSQLLHPHWWCYFESHATHV